MAILTGTHIWRRIVWSVGLAAAALVVTFVATPTPVFATIFSVTRTDDPVPVACNLGSCSLREAIRAANATPGPDTISLGVGTYVLGRDGRFEDLAFTGDLDITESVTITGAGLATTIIDAQHRDRVFHVVNSSTVNISDLTMKNGDTGDGSNGGALVNDGSASFITLARVSVQSSIARVGGGGFGGLGGGVSGVDNYTLVVQDSTFISNLAVGGNGGAIFAGTGTNVTIQNTTFSSNLAEEGGALRLRGTTTISNSAFGANKAQGSATLEGSGGAISVGAFGITTSTMITDCTMSGNETAPNPTGGNGGAIVAFNAGSSLNLTRVTIEGNKAILSGNGFNGLGGGVAALGGASFIMSTVTIRNNQAAGNNGGGVFLEEPGTGQITDSSITGNVAFSGGGIRNRGAMAIARTTIGQNTAGHDGAGVFHGAFINGVPLTSSSLTIDDSTLSGNIGGLTSQDTGAGLNMDSGTAILRNVTISTNTAGADAGVHISGTTTGTGAALTMNNGTVAFNTATQTPFLGGVGIGAGAVITLRNSLIANNNTLGCGGAGAIGGTNNIEAPTATCPAAAGFTSFSNPKIGVLANNGGPSQTHALLNQSPALDRPPSPGCPSNDQRGIARPQGPSCDVGAYEAVENDLFVGLGDTVGAGNPLAPGQSFTITAVAANAGTIAANGAPISLTLPTNLLVDTWTCVGIAGSQCGASAGNGPISSFANLSAGGSVQYTMNATVPSSVVIAPGTNQVILTFTVGVPATIVDSNNGNNTAQISHALPLQPRTSGPPGPPALPPPPRT